MRRALLRFYVEVVLEKALEKLSNMMGFLDREKKNPKMSEVNEH